MTRLAVRLWIETMLAAVSAALMWLAVTKPTWIEDLFGVDPDGGDGSSEWGWALMLAASTVLCVVAARRTWKRRSAPATGAMARHRG